MVETTLGYHRPYYQYAALFPLWILFSNIRPSLQVPGLAEKRPSVLIGKFEVWRK